MQITFFRYLAQGKRPALLVGGGEKTKQMGLGDVSVDVAEDMLKNFLTDQKVQLSSNYHTDDLHIRPLAPAVDNKNDFLQEFNEWLRCKGSSSNTPAWEKIYPDLYVFFFTGCATDKGDLLLTPAASTTTGGSASSSSAQKEAIISLLDIEKAWDQFKDEHLPRVMSYEEYRDNYYTSSGKRGSAQERSSSSTRKQQIAKELSAPATAQVSPLLWLILDSDFSNHWVDYAYSRNYRDIVIQGFTDGGTAPLHVVAKAWMQLQSEHIDNRQFGQFLKAMGGSWATPKVYAMPGFRFPPWYVPNFQELYHMLITSNKKIQDAEGPGAKKVQWIFERREDPEKDSGFSFICSKDKPIHVYQIQLAQGRRQVLAQSFSVLQAEVEEAIHEVEALRLLYADGDIRPNKDNRNNLRASGLEQEDSLFSGEKLLFVLHTLKIYLYTPRVCSAAVRALWALTYNEEVRSDLITPVVIELLLKVTKLHIHDPKVCLYATGVISRCAWNLKIWRNGGSSSGDSNHGSSQSTLSSTWNRLCEFILLHPAEEELVRLVSVSLAALSAEMPMSVFPTIFPITCDVIEFYLGNADTLYALLGLILQLIAQHVPESSEDCLRVFALLLQVIEKHPENGQMTRQCALGFLRLSTNNRAKEILLQTTPLFNLFLNLIAQSVANFLDRDPYVVWQMISCLLNFLKSHAPYTKKLLFVHPKCRQIHDLCVVFTERNETTANEYDEVLKQQVREFLHIFQSEKGLMRQMRINEKRKEKL
ncbi:unnamed protein product [Amoebophrya sp. A120]|nr:unnamed protein product [Amoebophrya sp. A120]|eukprot:GSA120T00006435001.1